jgi:hypothetical protein
LCLRPQVAKWGTHALAAAAKRLVEAAVLDRRNQRFVLVGDTTGEGGGAGAPWPCMSLQELLISLWALGYVVRLGGCSCYEV